ARYLVKNRMLSTWSWIVCSFHPARLSQRSKPSRIGWLASWIAWARCSYVSAESAVIARLSSYAGGKGLLGPAVLLACPQESPSSEFPGDGQRTEGLDRRQRSQHSLPLFAHRAKARCGCGKRR